MTPELSYQTTGPGGLARRAWVIAWSVAAAACLIRILFANQRGFWLDEYFTLNAAQMSIPDMVRNRIQAGHSPLYFFYARLGLLCGMNERALRVTSALAAGAAVLLLTGLLGELRLGRALPWMWALAVVEPYWLSVGMEYRYTMPLIALAAAAAWIAARYAAHPDGRRGTALMLATGLLLWTHGSAPFFVLGLLIFLLWEGASAGAITQRMKTALCRIWPVVAGILLGVPFYYLVRHHGSNTEDKTAQLKDLLQNLLDVVFGDHRLWFVFFKWHHHGWLLRLETALLVGAIGLTWRELRRAGNPRAWRLLASTLISIPLVMFCFCVFVKNFQGPVRYLATFSIPATVCLALAAATARPRWLQWSFGAGLIVALIFQSSAMALDRGDRHREAIAWLINTHREKDPILISTTILNHVALKFKGFNPRGITVGGFDPGDSLATVEAKIQKNFGKARRGLYIRYHTRAKVLEALDDLTKKGFFAGQRRWKIGRGQLVVGAVIRDKKEQAWLDGLHGPRKEWGPAQTDK